MCHVCLGPKNGPTEIEYWIRSDLIGFMLETCNTYGENNLCGIKAAEYSGSMKTCKHFQQASEPLYIVLLGNLFVFCCVICVLCVSYPEMH